MQLRRIDPTSVARVAFFLYAILGFFGCFVFAGISLLGVAASGQEAEGFASFGVIGLVLLCILGPLVYGAVGAFCLLLVTLLYNGIAKRAGGIEVELG